MGIASLAEAVILQSIEDLYNQRHRKESVRFLTGEGFRIASDIARIAPEEAADILTVFSRSLDRGDSPAVSKVRDRGRTSTDLKKAAGI